MARFKSSPVSGVDLYVTGLAITSVLFCVLPYSVLGQTGVSLSLKGAVIVNDGYVNVLDIGATANSNTDGLICHSDSSTCCIGTAQGDMAGHWYYPNDTTVDGLSTHRAAGRKIYFARNRGTNPGVVRLYLNFAEDGISSERGRFYCRAPNSDNNIQTVYVNILEIGAVTISSSGSSTAGETYSLMCSATIIPNPLPSDVPLPTFQWFFGSNNASLPSGVTSSTHNTGSTYTSTLQFSPLSQSHAGMYTCRLGGNQRLAANEMIIVLTAPPVTTAPPPPPSVTLMISITSSGTATAGESYSLECSVIVTGSTASPTITWLDPMNNQISSGVGTTGSTSTLTFNPLAASHAGRYTCRATLGSAMDMTSFDITLQIPPPTVTLSSDLTGTITAGSTVTLTCAVTMNQAVTVSDLSVLMVEASLTRPDGTVLSLASPSTSGTTFTYTTQLNSFGRSDSGNYNCTATVRPQAAVSSYLTATNPVSSQTLNLISSVYLSLRGRTYASNNSNINITDIGERDDALLCVTNLPQCCDRDTGGEWVFPNGSLVSTVGDGSSFYRNRGPSVVCLHRRHDATSPTGQYCCVVPDASSNTQWFCANIDPTITVSIASSVATPMVGSVYSLTCSVTGAGGLTGAMVTYQWLKNGIMVSGQTMETFSFPSLTFSDAGSYTCQVNVMSNLFRGSIVVNSISSVDVILTLPTPTVKISSNTKAGMVFIGSTITFTCTVELSLAVDVPVTVDVHLSDPAGRPLTTTPPSASGSTYNFSTNVQVINFTQSGSYTCTASVNSTSPFLLASQAQTGATTIVVAAVPSPINVQATQSSSSAPVEVSWSPPSNGAINITGYRIFYGNGQSVFLPSIVTTVNLKLDGSRIGQQVSIRSEQEHQFSELIHVAITTSISKSTAAAMCNNDTSIALGIVILLVVLITVAVIAVLLFVNYVNSKIVLDNNTYTNRRRPLTLKEQSKVPDDLSVSTNVAYGQVKMAESSPVPGIYEELGAMAGGGAPDYATCTAGMNVSHTHTENALSSACSEI